MWPRVVRHALATPIGRGDSLAYNKGHTGVANLCSECCSVYYATSLSLHTHNVLVSAVLSLPTENATARMRAWRSLKASGAAVLRDGVYLMPPADGHAATLQAVAEDVVIRSRSASVRGQATRRCRLRRVVRPRRRVWYAFDRDRHLSCWPVRRYLAAGAQGFAQAA